MSSSSKMKIVYSVVKRNGRSYWSRIGVAFVNCDGSINVKLEAFPCGGEMQIRDYCPGRDPNDPNDLSDSNNPNNEVLGLSA